MIKEVWVSRRRLDLPRRAPRTSSTPSSPSTIRAAGRSRTSPTKIGDTFDWVATGSPCGTGGLLRPAGRRRRSWRSSTPRTPRTSRKVMDYLASEDIVKEFTERTLFLPGAQGRARPAARLQDRRPARQGRARRLRRSVRRDRARTPHALPAWNWADAYYGALVTRISQVMAGELTLDEAFARIDEDIKATRWPQARSSRTAGVMPDAPQGIAAGAGAMLLAPVGWLARAARRAAARAAAASPGIGGMAAFFLAAEHADLRHLRAVAAGHQLRLFDDRRHGALPRRPHLRRRRAVRAAVRLRNYLDPNDLRARTCSGPRSATPRASSCCRSR